MRKPGDHIIHTIVRMDPLATGALTESVHPVAAEAFALLRVRHERAIMSNVDRAGFVECMVTTLLGPEWGLMWSLGDDWAPWDIECLVSKAKIEIKQSAARQPWHPTNVSTSGPPRFDIRPRRQYSPTERRWTGKPTRAADLYIFCWHADPRRQFADHRDPREWEFIVVPTERLPTSQKTISLRRVRELGESVRSDSLALVVEKILEACGFETVTDCGYGDLEPREWC